MKKGLDRNRIRYKANKIKGFHFPNGFTSNNEGIRIDNGNSEIFRKLKGCEGTFNVSDIRELCLFIVTDDEAEDEVVS